MHFFFTEYDSPKIVLFPTGYVPSAVGKYLEDPL
jgi:hypothetical protein